MSRQFGNLQASELYCPKCRRAMPVRERLLLVLPTGELYEYLCRGCSASLGQRTVSGPAVQALRPDTTPRRQPHPRRPSPTGQPVRGLLA